MSLYEDWKFSVMFGNEYAKRIINLLDKSFSEDIYNTLVVSHKHEALIVSSFLLEPRNGNVFSNSYFGDVFFTKDNEIYFRNYDNVEDEKQLKIRVAARIIHDKENLFKSDRGTENLNNQLERIVQKMGRDFEFYSTLGDKDASYFVKELNGYFANDILTLHKVITENEVDFYKITSLLNKNEICFLEPFKTDKMFQSSLKVFFQEEFKICVDDLNDSNVSEYLNLIKTINY